MNFTKKSRKVSINRFLLCLSVSFLLHFITLLKFGMFSSAGGGVQSTPLNVTLSASTQTTTSLPEQQVESEADDYLLPQESRMSEVNEQSGKTQVVPKKIPKELPSAVFKPESDPLTANNSSMKSATESSRVDPQSGIPLPGLSGRLKRVEIVFEIFTGPDHQLVDTVRHLYVSGNGDLYGLSIKREPRLNEEQKTGELWIYEISGHLAGEGLSPTLFNVQGVGAAQLMALKDVPARVDNSIRSVRVGRARDGILDRQSLLYQFMINPPSFSGGELWLSDGVVSGLYSYRIAGFDSLPITVLGGLRAIKLVVSIRDSPETIELWLVPDMHYLPVKARHTDRHGVITEQVATSIDFK